MNFNWKTMSLSQKIAAVIAGIAVVIWVLTKINPNLLPIDMTYPAIALVTVCEAVAYWKENRKWAILFLVAAVVCFASFLLSLSLA